MGNFLAETQTNYGKGGDLQQHQYKTQHRIQGRSITGDRQQPNYSTQHRTQGRNVIRDPSHCGEGGDPHQHIRHQTRKRSPMATTRTSLRDSSNAVGGNLIPKALAKTFGAEEDVMEIDSPAQSLKKLLAEKAKFHSKGTSIGKRARDRAGTSPPPNTQQVISPKTGIHTTESSSN